MLVRLADEGSRVALVLLALARTSSAAFGGALIAALMIPHVVAAPAMGAFADRVRRRRPLYAGAIAGYGSALAACGVLTGRVPAWLVLAIAAAGGCCAPLITGGLTGLLRDLVPATMRDRAYSLDAMSYNAAGICGPVAAGLLVTAFGPGPATLAVAASAVVGGLVLCTLPIAARETGPEAGPDANNAPSMVGGVVVMWRDPVLRAVTVATSFGMLGEGALPLVAALIAVDYHAGYAAGALLSAAAAGALVGALAYARRPAGADRAARVVMLGLVASGLPLLLVPLAGNVGLSLALFAVSGFFVGPQLSALFASRDQRAPAEFHTQVFTLGAGLKITAAALGAALAGAVASRGIGAESLVLAVAGLHIIAGGIGALLLRGRGHRPTGPPTPAAVSQVPVDGCSGDHVEKL